MTENRPFALGGGASREVEILKGAYSQEGQYYNKNNNLVDQLLLLVVFFEYDSIPERYHIAAIAVIIIYYFRGRHARFLLHRMTDCMDFRGGNSTPTLYDRVHCYLWEIVKLNDSKLNLHR